MPEAPLRRTVHARMKGRGRERGKSRHVYGIERGEPVREGRERAAERRGRTRRYERERFLSWRTHGVCELDGMLKGKRTSGGVCSQARTAS